MKKALVLFSVAIFVLTSCEEKDKTLRNKLEGTWYHNNKTNGIKTSLQLNGDGTFATTISSINGEQGNIPATPNSYTFLKLRNYYISNYSDTNKIIIVPPTGEWKVIEPDIIEFNHKLIKELMVVNDMFTYAENINVQWNILKITSDTLHIRQKAEPHISSVADVVYMR